MGIRFSKEGRRVSKKKNRARARKPVDPSKEHDKLYEFAFGKMGLSPEQLAGLTPFQFELKCKGFRDIRIDDENRFRKLVYHLYIINTPADSRNNIDMDDLWPNANSVKKAEIRNTKSKTKVYATMLDFWKKRKGL